MIRRFQERDKLVEALRRQQIVQNEQVVAEKLADVAELIQIEPEPPGNVIISQSAADNDFFLILAGRVSI